MNAMRINAAPITLAVDLAKSVFELAYADVGARVVERRRLGRTAFAKELGNRGPLHVVMEACSSANYWGRKFARQGHQVTLLPAHAVRPYVHGNKTDRADAAGLLEALRCGSLRSVPVNTVEQQGVQALHRAREFHKAQRTAAINLVRGLLAEYGIVIPLGSRKVRPAVLVALEDAENELPMDLRAAMFDLLDSIAQAEQAMLAIEAHLRAFVERDVRSQRLQHAGGIGLLTATALSAEVGELDRFHSGRQFASYLGLTPREHSSGTQRHLGHVTKRGNVYLRTLLIHGARAVLQSAKVAHNKGQPLDHTRAWALALAERVGHNRAAVALANKTARRLWAAEHHRTSFDPNHVSERVAPAPVH